MFEKEIEKEKKENYRNIQKENFFNYSNRKNEEKIFRNKERENLKSMMDRDNYLFNSYEKYRDKIYKLNHKIYNNALRYNDFINGGKNDELFKVDNDLEYNKKIAELQIKEKRDRLFHNDERNLNHFQDEYGKQNEKERTIQSKEIKNDYYDWDKNNSIMSRYKTPNIQKPLEQYLINNNNYAKTPNPNNFIINKKINYLGESTLRHNPITCPIDDLEYNKYIINDLNKYLYDSKDKIGNNSNLDSAGDYNSFGGNYNSNNNRFASNGNMIINN